ncbi:hypothetical protein ACVWWN_002450 [Mycobacterium sp. URHB0021]|jgi:hypothetical protein
MPRFDMRFRSATVDGPDLLDREAPSRMIDDDFGRHNEVFDTRHFALAVLIRDLRGPRPIGNR